MRWCSATTLHARASPDYEGFAIPTYEACFEAYLAAARLTNPRRDSRASASNTSQSRRAGRCARRRRRFRSACHCPAAIPSGTASRRSSIEYCHTRRGCHGIPRQCVDRMAAKRERVTLVWLGPLFARVVTGWGIPLDPDGASSRTCPLSTENFVNWGRSRAPQLLAPLRLGRRVFRRNPRLCWGS